MAGTSNVDDITKDGVFKDYSYDVMDRLTVDPNFSSLPFSYDGNGNIGQMFFSLTYVSGSNQIDKRWGQTVQYDGMGNMIYDYGNVTFSYDNAGRLEELDSAGQTVTNQYNGKGERSFSTRVLSGTEQYIEYYTYAEDGRLLTYVQSEQDPLTLELNERTVYNYIWLDNIPVAQIRERYDSSGAHIDSQLVYIHSDHLYTPKMATGLSDPTPGVPGDEDYEAVVWRIHSDAYGFTRTLSSDPDGDSQSVSIALRFPGQVYYGVDRYNYNYYRDYDTAHGRYLESDPIGLGGGLNTYAYVGGNPLRWTDPTGLACNGQGCWNTPQERAYAQAGDWKNYYALAGANGDTYAREAGNVANNIGFWSGVTNYRLASMITDHLPLGTSCADSEAIVDQKMEAIRRALAVARVAQLDAAQASPTRPVTVSDKSISAFHNQTFQAIGGGSVSSWGFPVFGGDIPGSNSLQWCTAPACRP